MKQKSSHHCLNHLQTLYTLNTQPRSRKDWGQLSNFGPVITCHHENLDLLSPVIMKISTNDDENLDLWWSKSRPMMMKLSAYDDENLDLSWWKSRPIMMKILTVRNKISTVYHENLDCSSWKSRPFVMKINLIFWPKWRSIIFGAFAETYPEVYWFFRKAT